MSDMPSPSEFVNKMLKAIEDAESIDAMPEPGTFAREYAEGAEGRINADNVEALTIGAGVVNLLLQEAILRVITVAQAQEGDEEFSSGVTMGATLIAQIMAEHVDEIISELLEGPAFHRAFRDIVANF